MTGLDKSELMQQQDTLFTLIRQLLSVQAGTYTLII